MSVYRFTKFGDELLPRYDPQRDLSPAPALPAVQTGFAGPFDARAGGDTPPAARMIEFTGTYVGDPDGGLVDVDGAALTDGGANRLTVDRSVDLQVERLNALIGQTRRIERRRFADGALHYLTARLLSANFQTSVEDGSRIATISPRFETAQAAWHSPAPRRVSGRLDMSSHAPAVAGENEGLLAARQAVVALTFSRRGTVFYLSGEGAGGGWRWRIAFERSDPASGRWQIEVGPEVAVLGPGSVVDAASRFALADGHSVQPWIWLAPGRFRVEASEESDADNPGGGAVDLQVDFYEEYP